MEFRHESVLYSESMESLRIRPGGIYVDGTLGGGGHSFGILTALAGTGKLIGIDQDEDAIKAAKERLSSFDNAVFIRDNFRNFPAILKELGVGKADGILLDLGVSSYQLDEANRGFSYRFDAPLDMRMDRRRTETAADLVNTLSPEELTRILREYGEERFAHSIAVSIARARQEKRIETTEELSDIVLHSLPAKARRGGGHPAKRTFQAIRIALNEELDVLRESLDSMIDHLNPGGRICVITFHSLEDRIVKQAFKTNENPCICPPEFPVCVCGRKPKGRVVTKHPILPSEEELERNPRAASAKLRVFERTEGA